MKKIIRNVIKCRHCNTKIESNFTHDFKTCKCGKVAADGGHGYLKREGRPEDFEELSITEK